MSSSTLKEKITELNQMILSGKALEAFEKFYHDKVVMQENEQAPTIGKDANRHREIEFFKNVTDFRKAEVKGVSLGENLTTVIWQYDYTHKEWGERVAGQRAVRR